MKSKWISFGCFLIGYNYDIINNSSEIAAKAVKRYTSAIMIVCILWAFIGYIFTNRYMHAGILGSIAGAALFVIIIIQIERQIILSIDPSDWLYITRGVLAIMMAILGSVIIDQIIFKDDIELEKITFNEARVNKALPAKTEELRYQIAAIDSAISKKEVERMNLLADISKNPTTKTFSTQATSRSDRKTTIDTASGKSITTEKVVPVMVTTVGTISNPNISFIAPIEQIITDLRSEKLDKETALLNIRPLLEKDVASKVGFLDELKVMFSLISNSRVALAIWGLWFFVLLTMELLVLISKMNDKENDYDRTIKHQMDLYVRKLELFNKMSLKENI